MCSAMSNDSLSYAVRKYFQPAKVKKKKKEEGNTEIKE